MNDLPLLAKLPDKVLEILVCETGRKPVEAGTEVIHEHPVRELFSDFPRKRPRLVQIWELCLQPCHIRIGSKSEGTLYGSIDTTSIVVVPFTCLRC
jgi:hypothetical protein